MFAKAAPKHLWKNIAGKKHKQEADLQNSCEQYWFVMSLNGRRVDKQFVVRAIYANNSDLRCGQVIDAKHRSTTVTLISFLYEFDIYYLATE